jgi:hypothetical protein
VWYPSRSQWVVIWVGFALAVFLWLGDKEFNSFHFFVLIGVGLVVWMLEARRKPKP